MMRGYVGSLVVFAVVVTAACGGGNTPPQSGETAPGADRTAKTGALETGANLMQAKAPVEKIAMYLNGFHVSEDDPKMQMEPTTTAIRRTRTSPSACSSMATPPKHE